MTTYNHTAIATGAAANAATFNNPLGDLDEAIGNLSTLSTTAQSSVVAAVNEVATLHETLEAEVVEARGIYDDLGERLDQLVLAAGFVATSLTADATTGSVSLTVASITGFSNGDPVALALDSGAVHSTIIDQAPSGNTIHIADGVPTLASTGNVISKVPPQVAALSMLVDGQFTYPDTYPMHIRAGMSSPVNAPCVQFCVENDTDGSESPNYYDGGAFIRLKAGATVTRPRYLIFTKHDETDDWYFGVNSSSNVILYRSGGAHRLWIEDDVTYINSEGTDAIHLNYHGADTVGKGGLRVWSGGAAANQSQLFSVQPDDIVNTPASDVSVIINAGKTTDQTSRIYFQRQAANKYALVAGSTGIFGLYDYTNTKYAWYWNGSGLAIGHSTPVGVLYPLLESSATNTIGNVIAVGHNSTGTPAAGFGAAITFLGESATVVNRNLGRLYFVWVTATDSGRASKGRLTSFYETTERTGFSWEADASEAKIGFFATAPSAKQAVTGSISGDLGAVVTSLVTALATYGLITNSTTT